MEKFNQYEARAKQIKKEVMDTPKEAPPDESSSGTAASKGSKPKGTDDKEESKKMEGALSSAIVTEKPNIKWEDVCGLEVAKEGLKEAVIMPVKFP